MLINKVNQISLITLTSILFTGIGPGNTNSPFSAVLILIFIFIEFFKTGNFKLKIEKIFIIPLCLLFLAYLIGPFLDIKILLLTILKVFKMHNISH